MRVTYRSIVKRGSKGGGVEQVEAGDGGGRGPATLRPHRSPPSAASDTGAPLAGLTAAPVYTVTIELVYGHIMRR